MLRESVRPPGSEHICVHLTGWCHLSGELGDVRSLTAFEVLRRFRLKLLKANLVESEPGRGGVQRLLWQQLKCTRRRALSPSSLDLEQRLTRGDVQKSQAALIRINQPPPAAAAGRRLV